MVTVCVGLVVNYLFVRNILTHTPDCARRARYFLVLLAIAAIWFLVSRNPVVTTFVIPGICLVALVFDGVLLAVFRGTFVSGYAKYLLFDVGLGLIPLALQALGLTTWDVPSLVSALTASVFLLGLVVFAQAADSRNPQAVLGVGTLARKRPTPQEIEARSVPLEQ
ncbi:MAG: DUF6320 domain-containing protein [Eggerthella lenta]